MKKTTDAIQQIVNVTMKLLRIVKAILNGLTFSLSHASMIIEQMTLSAGIVNIQTQSN